MLSDGQLPAKDSKDLVGHNECTWLNWEPFSQTQLGYEPDAPTGQTLSTSRFSSTRALTVHSDTTSNVLIYGDKRNVFVFIQTISQLNYNFQLITPKFNGKFITKKTFILVSLDITTESHSKMSLVPWISTYLYETANKKRGKCQNCFSNEFQITAAIHGWQPLLLLYSNHITPKVSSCMLIIIYTTQVDTLEIKVNIN